ncbi:T9SS type A sorting domain-containing protein, partial [Dyadobacter sp. 3J3]|uniref:T9SS type A sorting domain-containing protein n=1 Tax=Dyadobacter sp. 3J3 TaxID=2606600 RepID=UPI00135B9617
GQTATLIATAISGATLNWYGTSITGGTASATAPTVSTATVGSITYYVSQSVGTCESPRSAIVVNVTACIPPAAPITQDYFSYCVGAKAAQLTAQGSNLKWYGGDGVTLLTGAPTPGTTDAHNASTPSFYVTQTINGCESPKAPISINVNAISPTPIITNPNPVCQGAVLTSQILTDAITPGGINYLWYKTDGTSSTTAPVPSSTTVGPQVFYVTQTNSRSCESLKATITVTVVAPPAAPGITAVSYCKDAKAVSLIGIPSNGGVLNWYGTNATGGTASSTNPIPETSATTSYYVSQTVNGCEGPRAKLDVTIKPLPAAPTIANPTIEYCQSVQATALTATGTTGSVLWYTAATGGTGISSIIPSTATEGTTSYYVDQTVNGCTSTRASVAVKINVTPKPAVATPSVAYCQNATATALAASGTNLKWYLTIDDTNPRTTPLTPYTAKVEDYSFYVTQTGTNTCESAKAEIKVHIKPLPSATISGNSSIPLGGTANVLINFTGDAPWTYILSNGISSTTSSASLSVPVSPTVTTNYSVTEVSNACGKGTINGIAIVTVQIPTLTIGVPSVSESCAGKTFTVQFQQSGSFPDGSTMKVQISTVNETSKFISVPSVVSGNVITATIPDTTIKGVYFVRIANVGKDGTLIAAGNVSSGQITVNPLPVATLSGTTTIYMGATANLKVDLTGDAPWTFSLNNGLVDSLVSTSVNPIIVKVTPKTTTTYTITKVSNQCGSGRGAGGARIQVDPVLGTEPPVVSGDWLKIYPTLVDSKCTVEITSAVSAKEADVEILDLTGRSLFKKSIREKITEVDFSQRPAGLYLIKVQNGKYSSVQRILKP